MAAEQSGAGDARRALPAIDRLAARIRALDPKLPAWASLSAARRVVEEAREQLASGDAPAPDGSALAARGADLAEGLARPHPARVVNATGVVLHTNLGRAPLAPAAAQAAARAASRYTDLELDLGQGRRGDRLGAVAELLVLLSGAEAAHVVNNNAAALLLAANSFARGREAIVSRGELVEIGGSFRLPDILEAAGVRLVEVGTTNRTHLDDYRRAIGPHTGLILKVHRSNFAQSGYVAEVELRELAVLARQHGVSLLEDLGSGTLVDLRSRGLPEESYVPARLRMGADAVCFSGDKLLGGPQAGILLGSADAVRAMRRNPLSRALRLDKLCLAALDATLRLLLEGGDDPELPVLRPLLEPAERSEARARALAARLAALAGARLRVDAERSEAPVGGGSLPGFALASWAVTLRPGKDVQGLARRLLEAAVPVLARVREDAVVLDVRTLLPEDEAALEVALASALADVAR